MSISNDSQILDEPHFGEPCMWNSTINYTYKFGRVGVTNANHFIGTDGNVYADLDVSAYSSSDLSSYFHPFQNLKPANHKNTRIDYALCPFTIFKNDWGYEPSEYERWSAYCTQQDSGVCMISAVVNLLLTYKYSTRHDCTNGLKPESLYDEVAKGCVTGDKGALELTFVVDVNKYLNKTSSGCYLNAGTPGVLVPYIANYHLHGDMVNGHTVMVIGRASSDYWWIFKTYWDIVLTWERNYDTKTMALDYENYTSIYYVDHQYQTGGYQLCKNQLTVTKDN
ncbi:MAG: hypothetical protein K6B51_06215 [Bacilli bacterium]|nr:hypothetical protein [Bacilli bacterium]